MSFQIAIDGPSASGKSTIARKLADKLNFMHIDTGLTYRLVTYLALKNGGDLENPVTYSFIDNLKFKFDKERLIYEGKDITAELRSPKIDANISLVSSLSFVREKMVDIQRMLASSNNVILDGRDITTVVLPDADIKVFLTASVDERAKRRYLELNERGVDIELEQVKDMLISRDFKDSTRKNSPLKKANDAYFIDSTNLDIEEVVERISQIVKEKINKE